MSSPNPSVSEVSDSEADNRSRSRSQSRRARRKKSTNKQNQQAKKSGPPMPSVPEDQQTSSESQAQAPNGTQAKSQAVAQREPTVEDTGMQPFEHIGPDSTSMDGPVTYAKAQRGEIPARPGNPEQSLQTGKGAQDKKEKSILDYDGLKLRLDLNLDIEIELKARIQGDLTLALM
ncbi:MAG: hypothetical protein MMC23_008589 [Stictis urceolatum]|nr:hypothetical protein [Stictis urceolata]